MRIIALFFIPSVLVFANPQLSSLIEGDVSFKRSGEVFEISASDRAIIEWAEFNIELSETTRFIQPHTNATVLNRILDAAPSRLMGKLEANGGILLINPNGILIGNQARIDTGSFIASTLDLQNDCFLANKELKFFGNTQASIINQGKIESLNGPVALVGWDVANHGSIDVSSGFAALLGGCEAVVRQDPNLPVSIRTKNPQINGFSLVLNEGAIRAGNDIFVFGERILLKTGSILDVSNPLNAHSILIGGDYQGKNGEIQNAEYLICESGAQVLADSLLEGNGGKVILWSDFSNVCFGLLSAKGGPIRGDGGFIEVSAPELVFDGMADLSALNGKAGLLYLDPTDVTIGAVLCGTAVVACPTTWTVACGCPVNISAAAIAGVLGGGADVCIDTSTAPDLACAGGGNITVSTGFTWATGANLFLTADNRISVAAGANILPTGAGDVTLTAPNIDIRANIQNTGGVGTAGNVILIAPDGGTIFITDLGAANVNNIGVGSQNGTTSIGDLLLPRCQRGHPNVLIQGATHLQGCTLGFVFPFLSVGAVATGPIDVVCNNLNIRGAGATGVFSAASVGHSGQAGPPTATNPSTTAAATISIDATGNILIEAGDSAKDAFIGHGGRFVTGGLTSFAGDICVNCLGTTTLQKLFASGQGSAGIGHGAISLVSGGASTNANVTVQSAGNITLRNNSTSAVLNDTSACFIGHGSGIGLTETRTGNISVLCGGNLTLDTAFNGSASPNTSAFIGHSAFNAYNVLASALTTANTNIYLSVAGNVSIAANGSGAIGIGTIASMALTGGVLEMLVGGNLTVTSGSGSATSPVNIGHVILVGALPATANTNIAVAGNVTITPSAIGQSICFTAPSNVNLAAGGNIIGTGSGIAIPGPAILGGQSNISSVSTTFGSTRVRAAGDILANPGSLGTPILIGTTTPPPAAPPMLTTGSLFVQAAGQLRILNGFRTTAGSINLATGVLMAPGDLWTVAANQLTSVAGLAIGALPFSGCALCTAFLNAPLVNSVSVIPQCVCATFNNAAANGNIFQTVSGDLNLEASFCSFCCPNASAIIGTTAADTINLQTVAGNVTISMFQNITVNTDMTGNNFLFLACQNIHFTPGSSIAALGDVDLVADNAFPISPFFGSGAFSMGAGSSVTSGGYLRIYTSQQGLNNILGTLNGSSFARGTLFSDTNQELWCTYYPAPLNGFPFTIFYKDCLQELVMQAMVIVAQFNIDLHPYNEFPGWEESFRLRYKDGSYEDYLLRRRNLNIINNPKSWTVLLPE